MERRVQLGKGSSLWEEKDPARTVAVLESGTLGVRVGGRHVGTLFPRIVLGEAALLNTEECPQSRTAAIFALEDNTLVAEHRVETVREDFESGSFLLPALILRTLIAQICKNALLVIVTNPDQSVFEVSLKGLTEGLSRVEPDFKAGLGWTRYLADFRFLYGLRNYTDQLREQEVGTLEPATVTAASELVARLYRGSDVMPLVETFIRAEREALLGP